MFGSIDILQWTGIVGMILIVLAWIPQTLRTIRTKKVGIEPKFLWFYFLGCIGLVIYSLYISDPVFLGLNSISLVLNSINMYYHYAYKNVEIKAMKKKQKK